MMHTSCKKKKRKESKRIVKVSIVFIVYVILYTAHEEYIPLK